MNVPAYDPRARECASHEDLYSGDLLCEGVRASLPHPTQATGGTTSSLRLLMRWLLKEYG